MRVYLYNKDILDVTEADTIALPMDSAAPNLIGGAARQFLTRIDAETLDEVFAPPLDYPFTGGCRWTQITGGYPETHFDYVCAMGTLSHAPGVNHEAVVRSALQDLFQEAALGGVGSKIAIPLLTGGGRIPPLNALHTMLREAEGVKGSDLVEVHIAERDEGRYNVIKSLMR